MTDTFNVTLAVPKRHRVESRGVHTDVDMEAAFAAGGAAHIMRMLDYGTDQKIADGASGALFAAFAAAHSDDETRVSEPVGRAAWGKANGGKVREHTLSLLAAAAGSFVAGEWSVRRAGGGASVSDPTEVAMFRAVHAFFASLAVANGLKPKRTKASDAEIRAWIVANASGAADAMLASAAGEHAWRKAAVVEWADARDATGESAFRADAEATVAAEVADAAAAAKIAGAVDLSTL